MYILTKHKKKGEEGFKGFVRSLATMGSATFKNVLQMALLEDPVYMKWIMTNLSATGFDFFTRLDKTSVQKVYNEINNPLRIFVLALSNFEDCKNFINEKFLPTMKAQFMEEAEMTQNITPAQQTASKTIIIEKMFELQKRREIPDTDWEIPAKEVLSGENHKIVANGDFLLVFENGKPALRGQLEPTKPNL